MAKERNMANIAQGVVKKGKEEATFGYRGDEVVMRNTPEGMAALQPCKLSKSDIRKTVDEYIRGVVDELCPTLRDKVDQELDRRIEVAIKSADKYIEELVKDSARSLVEQRMQEHVATLNIDMDVRVSGRDDGLSSQ